MIKCEIARQGFTVIELMVFLLILAIVSALRLPAIQYSQDDLVDRALQKQFGEVGKPSIRRLCMTNLSADCLCERVALTEAEALTELENVVSHASGSTPDPLITAGDSIDNQLGTPKRSLV